MKRDITYKLFIENISSFDFEIRNFIEYNPTNCNHLLDLEGS